MSAYDEKMVEELVDDLNSWSLQPELVALRVSLGVSWESGLERLVVAKEAIQTGLVKKENLGCTGHSMRMSTTSRRRGSQEVLSSWRFSEV